MKRSSSQPAISLEGVSLRYFLARQRVASVKEYFIHMVRRSLQYEELWALKDIALTVGHGESVGVVGPNGAGKTTLAKVVAGVLKPTRGRRRVEGVISPLLELGTGFDYELTGYENIFMNGLLLGRRRREITAKLDEIIAFSGIEKFIHTPIRNYSSGMVTRLGFSVATAWIPDVLILDEVLAVGDVRFLDRCHARLKTFREAGTTILLISHSPQMVLDYTTRCIWLDGGCLKADGTSEEVIELYTSAMHASAPDLSQGEGEQPAEESAS